MNEFLTFKKMLTPIIVQILFWILSVVSVIFGLIMVVRGANGYGGGELVLVGLLWMILGPVFVRIYCEILIVIFSINDTLNEIKHNLQK